MTKPGNTEPHINPQHPEFVPNYECKDRDTGIIFNAPFAAAVFGINKEFFGVGKVIGNINDSPMLEVQDVETGQPCYVMGYESWWTAPVPDEIVENMANGTLAADSVTQYQQRQEDYWSSIQIADGDFLGETGIDPDSL